MFIASVCLRIRSPGRAERGAQSSATSWTRQPAPSGLFKDRRKFSTPSSFHRARIDNPIDVMANAVEPLAGLQRCVRRIAWTPAFCLRRRVQKHLQQEAVEEFAQDYQAHFIQGESKPKAVGMPFLVKGRTRRIGVVLCHGYMAAPLEMKGLADYLGRRGYWVYVPRLRGHGTSPVDLSGRTHEEWIASTDRGYALIRSRCERVVAGGFSTGAGLALHLAARMEDLSGVFAVSAPMRLRDFKARFASAVDLWNRFMDKASRPGPKMEFVENRPEHPHINYSRNPVSGVREIERLMDDLEPRLEKIAGEGVIPFRYVAADSIYGNSPEFLEAIEKLSGVTYIVALPRDTLCWLQEPAIMEKTYRYGGE